MPESTETCLGANLPISTCPISPLDRSAGCAVAAAGRDAYSGRLWRRTAAHAPMFVSSQLALVASLSLLGPVADPEPTDILILRENGVGAASTAQAYVDQLMVRVAKVNGWAQAKGTYETKRSAAKTFIESAKPEYGILSLGAFLALRAEYKLAVIGQAAIEGGGGLQYYIVSKRATDLAGCKGKKLATNHGGDVRFIDKVVSGGAFTLADFSLEATTRPVQTLKKVLRDEAECALIDDAQMAELANQEGSAAVHPVWFSADLPPMPVVRFATAPAAAAKAFSSKLSEVCAAEGSDVCKSAGIKSLHRADDAAYAALVDAYGRK